MQGFIHGSGGMPLNFKIVGGTTEPANPRENTIWVNTDQKITSWVFSETEPTEPVEGMLWIKTGRYSDAEFNALRKNGIQVYPTSAKLYVSAAWGDVKAKTYQNGVWAEWYDWDGYLYKAGDQYVRVTGGWRDGLADGYWKSKSGNVMEFRSDCIYLKAMDRSAVVAITDKKIDLTDFSAIEIIYLSGTIVSLSQLVVSEGNINAADTEVARLQMPASSAGKPLQLDIKHLTGEYHVGIATGRSETNSAAFYVSEIRLVK